MKGDTALSGVQMPSDDDGEPLDFAGGEMDAFCIMGILGLGGPPLVGMAAVLVNDWVFSVVGLVISSMAVLWP